jgi:hypothetical protein
LPLSLLSECDAKAKSAVEFRLQAQGHVEVRWQRPQAPFSRTFAHGSAKAASFPRWPKQTAINSCNLLDDLDQAMQILSPDRSHGGYSHLRLRGSQGDIAATDGRQVLLQRGYRFGWKDSLLLPRTLVLGSPELPDDTPVQVAFSEGHVLFRIGPWTIVLKVEANARYPNVDALVPVDVTPRTCCVFDEAEAEALQRILRELPGSKEADAPITLDVNARVALRARAEKEPRCTEVSLPSSTCEGVAVRIACNRLMLQRALALGFRTVQIRSDSKPLMCQDERRTFLWAPLNTEEVIAPQRYSVRVSLDAGADAAGSARPNRLLLRLHVPPQTAPHAANHQPTARRPSSLGQVARGLWSLVQKFRRQEKAA